MAWVYAPGSAGLSSGSATHKTFSASALASIRKIIALPDGAERNEGQRASMAIYQLGEDAPSIAPSAWVAESAEVMGRVSLAEDAGTRS